MFKYIWKFKNIWQFYNKRPRFSKNIHYLNIVEMHSICWQTFDYAHVAAKHSKYIMKAFVLDLIQFKNNIYIYIYLEWMYFF